MTEIILPELGDGIKKATVSYWYFKAGERVREKDDLVELATDKATFNLPSPSTGIISKIIVPEGETVDVGTVLGIID